MEISNNTPRHRQAPRIPRNTTSPGPKKPTPRPRQQSRAGEATAGAAEPQQHAQAQAQPDARPGTVKSELRRLSKELEEARTELRDTLQHLAVVRYDAYGEMSGRLSWSMALLDDNGDGVVLTSINSRNDARSYAKEVKAFESDAKLSPEEEEAIDTLRKEASPTLGNPDHQ